MLSYYQNPPRQIHWFPGYWQVIKMSFIAIFLIPIFLPANAQSLVTVCHDNTLIPFPRTQKAPYSVTQTTYRVTRKGRWVPFADSLKLAFRVDGELESATTFGNKTGGHGVMAKNRTPDSFEVFSFKGADTCQTPIQKVLLNPSGYPTLYVSAEDSIVFYYGKANRLDSMLTFRVAHTGSSQKRPALKEVWSWADGQVSKIASFARTQGVPPVQQTEKSSWVLSHTRKYFYSPNGKILTVEQISPGEKGDFVETETFEYPDRFTVNVRIENADTPEGSWVVKYKLGLEE